MANLVVERDTLIKLMEDWLAALGVREGDKLEVTFRESEVIVRAQSEDQAELDRWLDEATRKYDSVLRRLAAS